MKCSTVPKGEKIMVILLSMIFWTGFLAEWLNEGSELTGLILLLGAVACIVGLWIGRQYYAVVDEKGITFSRAFGRKTYFAWEDFQFVGRYRIHTMKGTWGIIFSKDIAEYDIRGNITFDQLIMGGKKSERFFTVVHCSEEFEKALQKYVPYSKMIKRELQWDDFKMTAP